MHRSLSPKDREVYLTAERGFSCDCARLRLPLVLDGSKTRPQVSLPGPPRSHVPDIFLPVPAMENPDFGKITPDFMRLSIGQAACLQPREDLSNDGMREAAPQ
jgi:hypothetical protein